MRTRRILVADEDTKLLTFLSLHLRNDEYDVVTASEGVETLDTARETRPDILIFDISVTPDGIDTATDIRFKRQFFTN